MSNDWKISLSTSVTKISQTNWMDHPSINVDKIKEFHQMVRQLWLSAPSIVGRYVYIHQPTYMKMSVGEGDVYKRNTQRDTYQR